MLWSFSIMFPLSIHPLSLSLPDESMVCRLWMASYESVSRNTGVLQGVKHHFYRLNPRYCVPPNPSITSRSRAFPPLEGNITFILLSCRAIQARQSSISWCEVASSGHFCAQFPLSHASHASLPTILPSYSSIISRSIAFPPLNGRSTFDLLSYRVIQTRQSSLP